jgi:hypothetical protein
MKIDYLADALDHWKGSLFEYLQSENALRDLGVDPMATDRDQWNDADFCLYARLLRVGRDQIISHGTPLLFRDCYFAEIDCLGDIFLDPDTGIGKGSPIEKYVKPKELATLLSSTPGRVIAVYQHVRARTTRDCVDKCIADVDRQVEIGGWCSYESPSVAMIFLCGVDSRTREIAAALESLLGRHADRRVRSGPNRRPIAAS